MSTLDSITIFSLSLAVCSFIGSLVWAILVNDLNKAIWGFRAMSFFFLVFYAGLVTPFLKIEKFTTSGDVIGVFCLLVLGVFFLAIWEGSLQPPTGKPEPIVDSLRDI